MARNIEIKVRVGSIEALLPRARALADGDAQRLVQDDTFFAVPHGRLKLREFGDGSAELIHYHRPDTGEAKLSNYVRTPVLSPASMRDALERALGAIGRVRKRRLLLRVGATRIHLDQVQDLGEFIELEVVLRDDQNESDGRVVAEHLMRELGLAAAPRIACAYLDLLVAA